MAEILVLGLSHYPMLATRDEYMASLHKRMLKNPRLPPAMRDPANWPSGMREEWGDDEGVTAAADHRERLVKWAKQVRSALDSFAPDFVVIWGDDQYENFKEDVVPPYCVNAHEHFLITAPPNNVWGEPIEFNLPGNVKAAKMLASRLIEQGFDTAYSYKPLHHPLGHAFANGVLYLDYDRQGFHYPIIPVSVNCYGRRVICQRGGLPDFSQELSEADLDPPAPTPRRLFDMGAATAQIFADSPYRVALLASSSWSHAFLTPKNNYLHPDTPADEFLFEALKGGQYNVWRDYSADAVEESGQQEILNWMCAAGALHQLGRKAQAAGMVKTWIFNSSKVFLIAPP